MKRCMTELLSLLLALLLLVGTAGLAEAGGEIVIGETVSLGESPELEMGMEDGLSNLELEPDGLDLAMIPEATLSDGEANATESVTLGVGQKYKINREKLGKSLKFNSSKPKVASVTSKGVVEGKKKGTAVITCKRNKKVVGRWKVTVKPAPKKVKLNIKKLTAGKGERVQLIATTTKGSVTELKWRSGNKQIVSVNKNGRIKGLKPGKATVTVTTHNNLEASVTVTVKAAPKKVTLSAEKLELKPGAAKTLKAKLPDDTASYAMTWVSSDENVATVSEKGKVTAVADGTATITVTTFNGRNASCEVEVAESFSVPIDKEHFPDDTFREYVRRYDLDKDDRLSRQETGAVREIDLGYQQSLYSLKGIEYFKALEKLNCNGSLEEADVSQNTALTVLDFSDSSIRALDVTHNTELVKLYLTVTWSLKTKLDLSHCKKLVWLSCEESALTGVTIDNLPKLETADFLWCDGITKLDISNCGNLKWLRCPGGDDFGYLDYLNIDGCVNLEQFYCVHSQLKALDLSHCPKLVSCLKEGEVEEGDDYVNYTHGDYYVVVDKTIKLTPAPKA